MSELSASSGTTRTDAAAREETTIADDAATREYSTPQDGATTRDRRFARQARLVMVAWAFIWTAILTFLFVYGDVLTAIFL